MNINNVLSLQTLVTCLSTWRNQRGNINHGCLSVKWHGVAARSYINNLLIQRMVEGA